MNIIVYCGANVGNDPQFRQAASDLGTWIGKNGHGLVYGGGKAGLMGVVADAVLAAGGEAIGVIPLFLENRELAHNGLTDLITVETMDQRKIKMLELGDVCIALPGGAGTLEEIAEAVSWSRIGKNDNPCIFYDQSGYYHHLQAFYDEMVSRDFLSAADREKILFSNSLIDIEAFISSYTPPTLRKY